MINYSFKKEITAQISQKVHVLDIHVWVLDFKMQLSQLPLSE